MLLVLPCQPSISRGPYEGYTLVCACVCLCVCVCALDPAVLVCNDDRVSAKASTLLVTHVTGPCQDHSINGQVNARMQIAKDSEKCQGPAGNHLLSLSATHTFPPPLFPPPADPK